MLPDDYDDGAFSGGNTERPALQRLLRDIKAKLVDVVVVYKVDRLSRSLADFAQMIDLFDQYNVSLVSVTQQFNTTSSMGRLTLNILLSFAQFEREVTSERIRDKFLLSKKKGMWMGGLPPIGYDVHERKLVINKEEAAIIRALFKTFVKTRSVIGTSEYLNRKGYRTKKWVWKSGHIRGGGPFTKGAVHRILKNRLYVGEIGHKGQWYLGEHDPIISPRLWSEAQGTFDVHARLRAKESRQRTSPSFLRGLLFGPDGRSLTATSTRRNGQQFRYYVSQTAQQQGAKKSPLPPLPALTLEKMVLEATRQQLISPELLFQVWKQAHQTESSIKESHIRLALSDLGSVWDELFAPEKRRLIELLVQRIEVTEEEVTLDFRPDGIHAITHELQGNAS